MDRYNQWEIERGWNNPQPFLTEGYCADATSFAYVSTSRNLILYRSRIGDPHQAANYFAQQAHLNPDVVSLEFNQIMDEELAAKVRVMLPILLRAYPNIYRLRFADCFPNIDPEIVTAIVEALREESAALNTFILSNGCDNYDECVRILRQGLPPNVTVKVEGSYGDPGSNLNFTTGPPPQPINPANIDQLGLPTRLSLIEPSQRLQPIIGINALPLVSLRDAVQPLIGIVDNIAAQAHFAVGFFQGRSTPDNLELQQAAALHLYTTEAPVRERSFYYCLNAALTTADRRVIRPYFLVMRLILAAFEALPRWDPLMAVWRGVDGDFRGDYPIGTELTWWRFSSCTTDQREANRFLGNGQRTLFCIVNVVRGASINTFSAFPGEAEVLLPAGCVLRVLAQQEIADGRTVVVHLTIVEPEYPPIM